MSRRNDSGPLERLTWLAMVALGLAAIPAWVGAVLELTSPGPLGLILVAGGLTALVHEVAEDLGV